MCVCVSVCVCVCKLMLSQVLCGIVLVTSAFAVAAVAVVNCCCCCCCWQHQVYCTRISVLFVEMLDLCVELVLCFSVLSNVRQKFH